MNNLLKNLIVTTAVVLLAACGGGGGSAGTSPFSSASSGGSSSTADLIVTLGSPQVANTGSATATVTVTAVDAARNTLAGIPVSISADGDAIVTTGGATTTTSGVVTAQIGIGSNRGNRLITVTATSGAISKTATLQVVGTTVTSTLVPAVIAPSTAGQVQYHVVDQAGNPMSAQPVQIVATGLTPDQATGTTGINGDYIFNYTSPATVGSYTVTANIAGKTDAQTVAVQTAGTSPSVPDATFLSASASLSANPSVIPTNLAGSQTNRSEIRALFVGPNNLPIPNVRVRFDLNGDVNSIGGTFTAGTATLLSDANGVATTAYVSSSRSSPTDGVSVRACYGKSDTDPNLVNCAKSVITKLTVTSEPLGVTIGTNELVIVNELTYVKKYVISVADSAGVAKPDVNLVVSIDLPNYRKGFYTAGTSAWIKNETAICANEDRNRNGVLDPLDDTNGDGQLWPRKPDVIISLLQSKTRADGTAEVQLTYAKDHGSWVDALITVSASGVSGSEGRATYLQAPVPVDSASLKAVTQPPAYVVSPYGIAASCSNPN